VISYYRSGRLTVLHCGNRACSGPNTVTSVDRQRGVGYSSSVTIGADGLPLIAYGSHPGPVAPFTRKRHLKVVHCGNRACSRGNMITTVDKQPAVGFGSEVVIGADKRPLISYYDGTEHLRVLHCGNRACTFGNTSSTVSSDFDGGPMLIGRDGLPLIAYADSTDDRFDVLHCGNRTCTSGNTTTTLGGYPHNLSLTIGRDGLPLTSYFANATSNQSAGEEVLHCGNRACTSGNTKTAVIGGYGIGGIAIAIGADGRPVLAYQFGGELKVTHCGNRTCSSHNHAYVVNGRSTQFAAPAPALAIGADGLPLVSYVVGSPSGGQLKVLHCSNTACRPHP